MSTPSNRPIKLELLLRAEHPDLLSGLDFWLQLGLISDIDVKRFAQTQLICDRPPAILPESVTAPEGAPPQPQPPVLIQDQFADEIPIPSPAARQPGRSAQPVASTIGQPTRQPLPERAIPQPPTPPSRTGQPNWVGQILGSFLEEISILWLLFLGVFLVVASSAVLAALAWKNVSAVGQYGILWSYTLGFGLAAWWTGRSANLQLTSRMLQVATLLIIPVNFWMMDGFQLWRSPLGWGMVAIASGTLLFLQFQLLRRQPKLHWLNHIGLSLLQWGWMIPGIPLLATYVGTVGTVGLQLFADRLHGTTPQTNSATSETPSDRLKVPLELGQISIAFATFLLIGRATLVQGIPLSMLGLAIGMAGWLICWQQRSQARSFWSAIGQGLLGVAWLITLAAGNLWQALGISGLGLHLLWYGLHRHWDRLTTVGLIVVGVQTYSLLRVLLPPPVRAQVIAGMTQWAGLQFGAWELVGLAFFPSLLAMLGFGTYLKRQNQPQLATIAQDLTLGLGGVLALPGLFNPAVRSLYFLAVTVSLGIGVMRRSVPNWLIYVTHTIGLVTVLFWLNWQRPDLSALGWTIALLLLAVLEWGLCLVSRARTWAKSAWFLGLGVAALGSLMLCVAVVENWQNTQISLLGLGTPVMLTLLSRSAAFPRIARPQIPAILSMLATLFALLPAITGITPFLIVTAVGTCLSLINTQLIRHLVPALLTVGLGLASISTLAWRLWNPIPNNWILPGVAGLIGLLWLLWAGLRSRSATRSSSHVSLSSLFATAADGWAIALTGISFLFITFFATYEAFASGIPPWQTGLAVGMMTGAIVLFAALAMLILLFYQFLGRWLGQWL
ncbi:MAG: hypothetical protein VKJ24_11100, partial [Synechococcales bacterium]|nr:hypothetical protein [Synechococcales bacterium]